MGFIVLGVDPHHGLELDLGLRQQILTKINGAELAAGQRIGGVELSGGAQVLHGRFDLSEREQGAAQFGMRHRILRIGLQFQKEGLDGVPGGFHKEVLGQDGKVIAVAREHLKPQFAHLIGGLQSVADPLGWLVGIVDVCGGVIERDLHVQRGPFGQGDGLLKLVVTLPVEVPIPDQKQFFPAAIREDGPTLNPFPQIVGVRVDPHQVHIHRQDVAVFNPVVFFARWDVDGVTRQLEEKRGVGGGAIREIKADRRLDSLRFS